MPIDALGEVVGEVVEGTVEHAFKRRSWVGRVILLLVAAVVVAGLIYLG